MSGKKHRNLLRLARQAGISEDLPEIKIRIDFFNYLKRIGKLKTEKDLLNYLIEVNGNCYGLFSRKGCGKIKGSGNELPCPLSTCFVEGRILTHRSDQAKEKLQALEKIEWLENLE